MGVLSRPQVVAAPHLFRPSVSRRCFSGITVNHREKKEQLLLQHEPITTSLLRNVARGEVERGMAICGSGVGACVTANKVKGVRAALVHDIFSAHQGVEDDDMNVICFGARVLGEALAWDLTEAFLAARFNSAERHQRRLKKVAALED